MKPDTKHFEESLVMALDLWGFEAQSNMLAEEAAELIDAMMKYKRGRRTLKDMYEQMADVLIVMSQFVGIEPDIFQEALNRKALKFENKVLDAFRARYGL